VCQSIDGEAKRKVATGRTIEMCIATAATTMETTAIWSATTIATTIATNSRAIATTATTANCWRKQEATKEAAKEAKRC